MDHRYNKAFWAVCGIAALFAATTGCKMCAHPYDYCGPTFTGGTYAAGPHGRAGSILSGGPVAGAVAAETSYQETTLEGPQPTPTGPAPPAPKPNPTPPAKRPNGSFAPGQSPDINQGIPQENVISVTDRRIDESPSAVAQGSPTPAPSRSARQRETSTRQ